MKLLYSREDGVFTKRKWADGVTQISISAHLNDGTPEPHEGRFFCLEKVERRRARYGGKWYLADRCPDDDKYSESIYALKLAGPFSSLKEAKAMFLVFLAMKGLYVEET